jgi:hypothetical protein
MELQLDATITVFINLQEQLNMFRANFAHLQERKTDIFYNIWYNVLLCGRQGFPSVLLGTTCTSVSLSSVKTVKMGKSLPETVELILEINKTVIVASSWSSIFTLPTMSLLLYKKLQSPSF